MGDGQGTILVTGATGYVGRAVVARLAQDGRRVIAAVRTLHQAPVGVTPVALGDMTGPIDWASALAGVDCVIHCAARAHVLNDRTADTLAAFRAANRDAVLTLARAAATAGVRRLVFLSSIKVNGEQTRDRPFKASDLPAPQSDYAISKWEAEQGLAEIAAATGLEVVVIRPPLVFGPDPKGNLGTLRKAIDRGLPLPFGLTKRNRRDLVSLDTLADLIVRAINHPDAPGGVLMVSDGRAMSTRDIVRRIAADAGRRARLVPVPSVVLAMLLRLIGKRADANQLFGNLEVDISETRRRLDWRPETLVAA
ncbi:NAD-dependent epimerase/dehydratase domain-containing protein [Sphingomonas antarctica]|uniref:NAD-dependent epimerase/dehydratase family protein n=1 Tax=Sphingomonas antarctica TaxID=2040274 RepID=UPI0039E73D62